ncbi:DUF418 domain-containing protein [Novosphingobium sp.]|uniref:DUF418 domain-containing protein n=1 Tax=Novosphingobium sp. TaxID=1874826 RepID=UPI0025CC44B4|nr:DUF418 domain-containing protein [Novosphingobium sp.]
MPVTQAERLVSLDFIRGIAVLGIVFANIAAFGQTMMAYIWPPALAEGPTSIDKLFWLIQYILVDGKMRGLFTLLFGAGMMLFMERAWARGATRWLQARRLGWLLLFGLLHLLLLWHGDILHGYAISGIILLAAMKWQPRTKLITGLVLYMLGSLAFGAQMGGSYAASVNPEIAAKLKPEQRKEILGAGERTLAKNAETIALYRDGSFFDVARHMTVDKAGQTLGQSLFFSFMETVPLALMGMALFEMGLFSGGMNAGAMRKWGWAGLIAGSAATLALGLWAYRADFPFMLTLLVFVGASPLPRLAVILGLAALLAQWAPRAVGGALGARLVAAGRMAFSNYLGTSLLLVPIFNGWGLGLFGQFGRVELFGFVLAVWALMLLWSKPWLEHFRYGPLEWLWRCLTYWRIFPLRR